MERAEKMQNRINKKVGSFSSNCLNEKENVKGFLDFIATSGERYELSISNYTTKITSPLINKSFLKTMRSPTFFAAYSKIKADLKGKPVPNISPNEVSYFEHNFSSDYFISNAINIDLNSAYSTALYNSGVISDSTFLYLSKVKKMDRLASVGMMASKKTVFYYDEKGKLEKFEKIVNPLQGFFYYCVKEVQDVMNELRMIAGADYLFTWVDGIYILEGSEKLGEIQSFLKEIKYPFKVEHLTDFNVRFTDKKIGVSFFKDGTKKIFNIPAKRNNFANDMIDYLTNVKIRNL